MLREGFLEEEEAFETSLEGWSRAGKTRQRAVMLWRGQGRGLVTWGCPARYHKAGVLEQQGLTEPKSECRHGCAVSKGSGRGHASQLLKWPGILGDPQLGDLPPSLPPSSPSSFWESGPNPQEDSSHWITVHLFQSDLIITRLHLQRPHF